MPFAKFIAVHFRYKSIIYSLIYLKKSVRTDCGTCGCGMWVKSIIKFI